MDRVSSKQGRPNIENRVKLAEWPSGFARTKPGGINAPVHLTGAFLAACRFGSRATLVPYSADAMPINLRRLLVVQSTCYLILAGGGHFLSTTGEAMWLVGFIVNPVDVTNRQKGFYELGDRIDTHFFHDLVSSKFDGA